MKGRVRVFDGVRAGEAPLAVQQRWRARGFSVDAAGGEVEEEVPVLVPEADVAIADAGVEDLAVEERAGVGVVPPQKRIEVEGRRLKEVVPRPEVLKARVDVADVLAGGLELVDHRCNGVGEQEV